MATTAFDLQARIGLDTSEYEQGMSKTQSSMSGFASKLGSTFKTLGSAAMGAATTAVNLGKSLVSNVSDLANYGDSIDKASQKLGISAKGYQEWQAVLQHSGTDMSSMTASFKSLANAANGATEQQAAAFERLGLSLDYVSSISAEDLFKEVITRLQDMGESTERTAIASDLLGKGAMELGALLNTSSEDTQAMIDRVNELGGVMDDTAVKAAANFNDQLQDMQTAFDGAKRSLLSEFLPSISEMMVAITALVTNSEDAPSLIINAFETLGTALKNAANTLLNVIVEMLPQILSDLVAAWPEAVTKVIGVIGELIPIIKEAFENLLKMIPDLLKGAADVISSVLPILADVAIEIVQTLIDGLIVAAPQLITAVVEMIKQLALSLTLPENLTNLITSAVDLILVLVDALIDAIPQLLEVAPTIIANLVIALIENAPQLVVAAAKIVYALFKAISNDIPNAVAEAIMQLVKELANGFKDVFAKAKTWGKDLMDNFIGGISDKINALKDKVKSVAQTVKDFIGFSEPKKGPLSNFHTYAPDMMQLFAEGIEENEDLITNQFDKSLSGISVNTGSSRIMQSSPVININATVSNDYDTDRMIQRISQGLYNLQISEGRAVGF